jgi:hypothetical protein
LSFLDRVSEFNAKEGVHRYLLTLAPPHHTTTNGTTTTASTSTTTTTTSTTTTAPSSTPAPSSVARRRSASLPRAPSFDELASAIAAFRRNPKDFLISNALHSLIDDIENAYYVTSISLSVSPIPEDDFEYTVLEEIIHKLLFAEFMSKNKYGSHSFESFRSIAVSMVPIVNVSVLIGIARRLIDCKKKAGLVVFISNMDAFEGLTHDSDTWWRAKSGFPRSKRLMQLLCGITAVAGPDVRFAAKPQNWDLAHHIM